jgi:hypothetical protein
MVHFYKINLFIVMELDKNKLERLKEKLMYLYKIEFQQTKFVDTDIDIEFEQMQNTDGEWILERVNIGVDFEYDGALDGDDVHYFTRDLKIMCDKFNSVIKKYTPTQEGKIIAGDSDVYVAEPSIYKIKYVYEDTHTFTLSTYILFED